MITHTDHNPNVNKIYNVDYRVCFFQLFFFQWKTNYRPISFHTEKIETTIQIPGQQTNLSLHNFFTEYFK